MIERLAKTPGIYFFIFIFYVIGLSGLSIPLTGDQKTYLSIALEMRERGEWIIPYLFNVPNFLKPPFEYWATLVGWKIFGFGLFGALIPSVFAMLASVFIVNRISVKLTGIKNNLAGLFFSASIGTMTYASTAQMEIWIVLFYLWAWCEFLEFRYFRAFLVVGVMAWIKGPLYPVLWVLSAGFWFSLHGTLRKFFSKRFVVPLVIGMIIGLTWYGLAARTQYQEMMDTFFLRENFSKMQVKQGSPFTLWGEFFYSIFPWVFLFLVTRTQNATRKRITANWKFLISYSLIPAAFFTFFPYRVNTYLYLLTPLMAWIVTVSTEKIELSVRTKLFSGFFISLMAILIFLVFRLMSGQWIGVELAIPFVVVFILLAFYSWTWERLPFAILSLILVSLIRMSAIQLGEKDFAGLRQYKESHRAPLAYYIQDKDIWHEYGLMSAAIGEPLGRLYDVESLSAFLEAGGAVIFQEQQELAGNLVCSPWLRLKRRIRFPIKALMLEGLQFGDPTLTREMKICVKSSKN